MSILCIKLSKLYIYGKWSNVCIFIGGGLKYIKCIGASL